jgi:hypothetical protein
VRERLAAARAAIEALRVHDIGGHDWECYECHYHFINSPCHLTGKVADADGEFDSTETPCDHGALLDRGAVLAVLAEADSAATAKDPE